LLLIQSAGHLVDKDELMKSIWPDSFVEEVNLNRSISTLRRALGEKPNEPSYIETVPKRGYRFIAPVGLIRGEYQISTGTESGIARESESGSGIPIVAEALNRGATKRAVFSSRRRVAALAGIVILSTAAAVYFGLRGKSSGGDNGKAEVTGSLAVLPFR